MNIDIRKINEIALKAGDAIMEIYASDDFEIALKQDNSPLTKADRKSNEIISGALKSLYPEIPVLSEEGKAIPYEERKHWEYFWLVDPLDGTKEFIKHNGEFTVNIALLHLKTPVAGVIYAPALSASPAENNQTGRHGTLYFSTNSEGAHKIDFQNGKETEIHTSEGIENSITVVQSRSHSSEEEENFLLKYNVRNRIAVGSSLKFCMIAEGKADLYYRHGPTYEWDTAAGQAVLTSAGGRITDLSGNEFVYNKPSLLNSSFIAARNGIKF